jgi:hypothetical protein
MISERSKPAGMDSNGLRTDFFSTYIIPFQYSTVTPRMLMFVVTDFLLVIKLGFNIKSLITICGTNLFPKSLQGPVCLPALGPQTNSKASVVMQEQPSSADFFITARH